MLGIFRINQQVILSISKFEILVIEIVSAEHVT